MPILHGEFVRLKRMIRGPKLRRYFKQHSEAKLHLGSGKNNVKGWLNVDKFSPYADVYLNAYDRFPFEDNSFSTVYSEHMIEHIIIEKIPSFLEEVHRVLKPGGVFRVTTPDLELFAKKYLEGDRSFFDPMIADFENQRKKNPIKYWLVRTKGGAFMTRAVRNFFHHRWIYDFETLESCLKEVGFSKVIKQSFGKSLDPEAGALDKAEREFETLYIDAVK